MAYGVSIGTDLTYGWEDQIAVLVTVSNELNIVVCASETSPARYIDISHDQIESVSLEKRQRKSQSTHMVPQSIDILVIWLTRSSAEAVYLGAGKRFAHLIKIAFTSIAEATAMMKRLLERAPHIFKKFTCSESEPLNLSHAVVEKAEEQGILCDKIAQVDAIRPGIVTSATESVLLPGSVHNPEPDLIHSFLHWPKTISNGVLRTTDLKDVRSDTGVSIECVRIESAVSRSQSPTKNLEDMSEGSLRNSAEWRKGAMLIETAPELQDTYNKSMEEGELSRKSSSPAQAISLERDGDHKRFFNAIRKGQDTNTQHAEQGRTHNKVLRDLQQALEHTLVHSAKTGDVNETSKAETCRNTTVGAAKSGIEVPNKNEHVTEDKAEFRKSLVGNKRYTSKKKLPAPKSLKKMAFGQNQPGKKAESLGVKVSRTQRDNQGEDEFDFPLSPREKRTPQNVQHLIPKKFQPKEGAICPTLEEKPIAHRSIPLDADDSLVRNIAVENNNPGVPPNKTAFKSQQVKTSNGESAKTWDEGLVDEQPNGIHPNHTRKRPPRSKANPTAKKRRNKDDEAYSSKKGLGGTMRKIKQKSRPAPRPAPQPRSRRAAALIADQRIKNSVNYNTSQEQIRGELTHDIEDLRPKPSQEMVLPNVITTTPAKRGTTFAVNLKKALSSAQMSVEHYHAPEERMHDKSVVQGDMYLETSLARPSAKLSTLKTPVVKGFRLGDQHPKLETPGKDPGILPGDALQEPSKKSERLYITVSPSESTAALHSMGNSSARQEKNGFSFNNSENEIEVDESPKEEQVRNIQAWRTPERPKQAALEPVDMSHRIRRADPHRRLSAEALNSTPTKISRDVNRKSNLISFTNKGPRNQGVIFKQMDQLTSPSPPKPSHSLVANVDRSLKRKLPIGGGDISDSETGLGYRKRPRISTRIPKLQDMAQYRSSVITDTPQRPSSQGTRVKENGSPMPMVRSRYFVSRDNGGHESAKIGKIPRPISDDDQSDLPALGDTVDAEPGISTLGTRLPKPTRISWRNSSSDSKHQRNLNDCQSSISDELTAHRVHPDGGFINVDTEAAVLPIRPPDPFTESRKTHHNAFMEMLRRRSSNLSNKPLQSNRLRLPGRDPDKTILENQTKSTSTESSFWDSPSGKHWSSSESSSSDEEEFYEEESWRDRLEPHQKGQLDALYDISHVSCDFPGLKPITDARA